METLYFILGALSVVTLFAVVSVFRIKGELKEFAQDETGRMHDLLGRSVDDLEKDLQDRLDMIERRIDQEIDRVNEKESSLFRYIDSRTDKLADGISKHIAEINTQIHDAEKWALHHNPASQR